MKTESAVAAHVRSLRSASRMTQAQVAEAMTGEGFAWRQRTVSHVEGEKRSLLAVEYFALKRIYADAVKGTGAPGEWGFHDRMASEV